MLMGIECVVCHHRQGDISSFILNNIIKGTHFQAVSPGRNIVLHSAHSYSCVKDRKQSSRERFEGSFLTSAQLTIMA